MNWVLEIVIRNPKEKKSNFDPLPKRWIVERTFAWFDSYRRLSKEYEYAADTSEFMVELAGMKLIINRLDKKKTKVFHKKKISDD
jgi:putative transposase